MKKVFLTGITGTVAPYLKDELVQHGYVVFDQHFRINSDEDLSALQMYLEDVQPDIIVHLALGPFSFTETLARYCKDSSKVFVYVSTVSVFEDNDGGPYFTDTEVTVTNEYGKYKYDSELLVKSILEDAYIIRIGWQISEKQDANSNNMFRFIKENLSKDNVITVSDQFYPSCSFLPDTVKAIRTIIEDLKPDLYFTNSNQNRSLYDVLLILKDEFKLEYDVRRDSTFARNDIMIDDRVKIKKL